MCNLTSCCTYLVDESECNQGLLSGKALDMIYKSTLNSLGQTFAENIQPKYALVVIRIHFKASTWLLNIFQPIRMLKTSFAKFNAGNVLYWIGPRMKL